MSDEYLLSLLRRPLPSFEDKAEAPSHSEICPPLSFEDPFDDPSMEPSPLKSCGSAFTMTPTVIPLMSMSIFKIEDCTVSSFFSDQELKNPVDEMDLRQSLIEMLDPAVDFVVSKRRSQDVNDPVNAKRQRISQVSISPSDETTDRFRPYQEKLWRSQFQKLVQFKYKFGHCCVPHTFPEDQALSRWVKRQRYQYKKFQSNDPASTMTTRRIRELESIGFVWNSHTANWFEKLDELKAFMQKSGYWEVPSQIPEHSTLDTWVKCQRRQFRLYVSGKKSNMSIERLHALKSVGFVFDTEPTPLEEDDTF